MRRREFMSLLGGAAAAWPLAARAQQAESTRRLGVLMPFEAQDPFGREIISALREGLKERGWADGRNIRVDERWIAGNDERRSAYAAELVRSSPDVIFACYAGQLTALLRETRTIPIVFVGVSDPVAAGYVESFARPGGNVTGFVFFEPSMVGKWLGVLKEVAPALSRIGFMVNPETSPHYGNYFVVFTNTARSSRLDASYGERPRSRSRSKRSRGNLIAACSSPLILLPRCIGSLSLQSRPGIACLRSTHFVTRFWTAG